MITLIVIGILFIVLMIITSMPQKCSNCGNKTLSQTGCCNGDVHYERSNCGFTEYIENDMAKRCIGGRLEKYCECGAFDDCPYTK